MRDSNHTLKVADLVVIFRTALPKCRTGWMSRRGTVLDQITDAPGLPDVFMIRSPIQFDRQEFPGSDVTGYLRTGTADWRQGSGCFGFESSFFDHADDAQETGSG